MQLMLKKLGKPLTETKRKSIYRLNYAFIVPYVLKVVSYICTGEKTPFICLPINL